MPSPQNDYIRGQTSPTEFLGPILPPLPGAKPTSLLAHLADTTPSVSLVRTVNYGSPRGLQDYFWWDIRQLRTWRSFSLSTFNEVCGLTQLLKTPIHGRLPENPPIDPSRLSPESENSLIGLINDIYAPRINTATRVSQGPQHMMLYVSPDATASGGRNANGPHFLGGYAADTDVTASGSRRARVVGIAKSFDRWNSGMRNDRPHRRVDYLRGLAHLQRCMREHSCRYGFIISEIELVCVRAGCDAGDDTPYFGYLEVSAPIATKEAVPDLPVEDDSDLAHPSKTHSRRSHTPHLSADDSLYYGNSSSSSSSRHRTPRSSASASCSPSLGSSSPRDGEVRNERTTSRVTDGIEGVPMTASMALYFLLMLAKAMPLPNQPSGHLNVGPPGQLTRQRILPDAKDKWIPEPQQGEKRDAKRVRGWIWPQDAWHRREGTRPKNNATTTTTSTNMKPQ